MRQAEVTLPSRLKMVLRALTLREESILASTKGKRAEEALNQVLAACCVEITDPGPYENLGTRPNWMNMLQGDRFATMFELRMVTHDEGHLYEFRSQCPYCRSLNTAEANLREEFSVQSISDEMFAAVKSKTPFTGEVAGKKVEFAPSFVRDITKGQKLRKKWPERAMAVALCLRLTSVEGVPDHQIINWLDGEGKGGFEGITSADAEVLRDLYDKYDVGIDTEVELECPECRGTYEIDLPFDDSFWSPARGARKRKKERRLGLASSEEPQKETSSDNDLS